MGILVDAVYGTEMRARSEKAKADLAERIKVSKSQPATRLNAIKCFALEVAHRKMVENSMRSRDSVA